MKVKVISGDEHIFASLAFGKRSRESVERSARRLRDFRNKLRPELTDRLDRIEKSIYRYLDDDVTDAVRRANRNRHKSFRDDIIMFLANAEEISDAPESNRRWLLSSPRMRNLFKQQRLHAWGCKPDYIDIEPGEADPYYVAIKNGEVVTDDEGNSYSDYVIGGCDVDGIHLSRDEQLDLIATLDVAHDLLDQGIDPTSPLGESV